MIIALPVCAKDEHLAIANLQWCIKLDGQVDFHCVVCHDTSFNPVNVLDLARSYFTKVTVFCYDKWSGEPKWPHPQNWAWQSTARYLAKQKTSWLWWEADAVPLRKGWIQALKEAKEESAKPFMGCIMSEWDGHMNGVGIYPADVHSYTVNGLLCRSQPFDVVMANDVRKHAEHTPLIQHVITPNGSSFPNADSIGWTVNEDAVLFHRCKDGTLIRRLEESRNWVRFVPSFLKNQKNFKPPSNLTVVITNFKRPQFLKEAFNSAVEAGVESVVVSSSGATAEIESIHRQLQDSPCATLIVSEKGDSGCNSNWLSGVESAPGDWVTILHDDDLLMPEFKSVPDELNDDVGFVLWDARRHGMGYNDIYPTLDLPTGIYPSKKLFRNLMIKDGFTISPTVGCFRKKDLIETLREAGNHFGKDFHLHPTMMVGNDLLIWLRAIQKHRFFKYIKAPLTSYGHHYGSTTCDEVFNKRGRLAPIYNRTREYFSASHPIIWHVVSRYHPQDSQTQRRVEVACQTWETIYKSGMVKPVHVWDCARDSKSIGDPRKTHFLRDVLTQGLIKARAGDYIMFTNDDSVLHPDLPWLLFDFMLKEDAACAFRTTFQPGSMPDLRAHQDFPKFDEPHDLGRDMFCFKREWLERHFNMIPDYVLGANDFDSTLALLIRMTKGIAVTDQTWLKRNIRCEIPGSFVLHEFHSAVWATPHNRKNLGGNIYNRELTKRFISSHGVGWFIS